MIVLWALGPPVVGWLLYMLRRHLLKVVVFFAALPAFLMKPVPFLVILALALMARVTRPLWRPRFLRWNPRPLRAYRLRRWAKKSWPAVVQLCDLVPQGGYVPPLKVVSTKDRLITRWTLPIGKTLSDVQHKLEPIGNSLGATQVTVTQVMPGVVDLVWSREDPLSSPDRALMPEWGKTRCRDGVRLGRDELGREIRWRPLSPPSHIVLAGGTRSGKSVAAMNLLNQFEMMPDVGVVGIDPTGILLAPFVRRFPDVPIVLGATETDLIEGVKLLDDLVSFCMENRLEALRRARMDALREVSPKTPLLLVVLEEWPGFLAACAASDAANGRKPGERLKARADMLVQRLLAEGLKVGMVVMIVAQRADADVLGGYRRAQISTRVAFRQEDAEGFRMLWPSAAELGISGAGLRPGEGYASTPEGEVRRFRGDYLDYQTYYTRVAGVDEDELHPGQPELTAEV